MSCFGVVIMAGTKKRRYFEHYSASVDISLMRKTSKTNPTHFGHRRGGVMNERLLKTPTSP